MEPYCGSEGTSVWTGSPGCKSKSKEEIKETDVDVEFMPNRTNFKVLAGRVLSGHWRINHVFPWKQLSGL